MDVLRLAFSAAESNLPMAKRWLQSVPLNYRSQGSTTPSACQSTRYHIVSGAKNIDLGPDNRLLWDDL
jgi:hypothetical protein